jgi:hypothetical protein
MNIAWKRGVFVLTEKLPSGAGYQQLAFSFDSDAKIMGLPVLGQIELAIFNEMMFANWFLVKRVEEGAIPDEPRFLISEIANQKQWDFIKKQMAYSNVSTAVLNPCNIKSHECKIHRFNLEDANDFDGLKEWFSKLPSRHIFGSPQ